ncbi:MAG TPA: molybdopterin-dependent oxidoreductase [Pyrinomonadaceae bacterium]|nr:molybdopterin-dependent oxidoreductase [Pyrinomonadaceae bacterium]
MNRPEQNEQTNEQKKQSSGVESEVLVEKVREIELAKRDAENADKKNSDKNNTAQILNERQDLSLPVSEDEAQRRMRNMSRRGFLIGGATAVFGYLGYNWLREPEQQSIFTRTFEFNENLSQTFYSPKNLAPEFPRELAGARVNGGEGMSEGFNAETWNLQVGGLAGRRDDLILTLDDIKSLPRMEMTTELKCIEGWSIVVNWVGARFSDFALKYPQKTRNGSQPDVQNRPQDLLPYVSLVTPDEGYYVGWDMPSIMHPQTLLVYEMNGAPLALEHGAPLRLATTTKYGIKQINRIGRIEFTDERPRDFWAERGYDWYSGH